MKKHLVVMLKEPRAGRVKTRLGRDLGMTASAWWFRHQTARLLRRLDDPRWSVTLAVAPDREGLASRVWPRQFARIPQGQGDLGDRMGRFMHGMPTGPVCIIGGDIPGIRKHHINEAFRTLGNHDAVFGPAPDGGFWLVGLKRASRPPVTLFKDVRWSTEHALTDTVATLGDMRIGQIETLQDVDTIVDLAKIT